MLLRLPFISGYQNILRLCLLVLIAEDRVIAVRFQSIKNARSLLANYNPSACSCLEPAVVSGTCSSSEIPTTFQSSNGSYVACAPFPVFDPFTLSVEWSICVSSLCLPSGYQASGYTISVSAATIENINMLAISTQMTVSAASSQGASFSSFSLSPSGSNASQELVLVNGSITMDVSVPTSGWSSLTLLVSVDANASYPATLALILSSSALAGQPPSKPVPPSPPPPINPPPGNVPLGSTIYQAITNYLVGYQLGASSVTPFLHDNVAVSLSGYYITVTAGYSSYSEVGSCSSASVQAYSQAVAAGGFNVSSVICSFLPAQVSTTCTGGLVVQMSVTIFISDSSQVQGASQQLGAFLTSSPASNGLGASCITNSSLFIGPSSGLVFSQLTTVDSGVNASLVDQLLVICENSQTLNTPTLASSLNLSPLQLTVLSCSLNIIYAPNEPPYQPPEAPPLTRYPYSVWKSAVLGGVLGAVFLLEVIVLAVWMWRSKREQKRAEAALAMTFQGHYQQVGGGLKDHAWQH
ncbi:hypothetical protein CEUSTIGMA_g835.t1 [Chlamydomonas eustigma]|uniref:Pherophorin domain-containing protein n=1 Tax=Chlamydomonas eustigma TaxID=1157962 RepID=A0A250WRT3_9CHLO|nr:hypothetical protein CEUSTIGMA_g835.t1 [Chlamydomonas eustigma]|eukprot:GAX73382.1 hypothetical protein CEUSTIGMA_g835.t1 [Chlamydomonas eustigma]